MKYRNYSSGTPLIIFVVILLAVLGFGLAGGCKDAAGTKRVLAQNGYTNIVITGWRPFMKSEKDWYSTGFEATSPNGAKVTGAVTSGLFWKGNTIRFD
jgi:hypothetical protein